ncbi:isochorismatase family protein [Actinokineospora auranticolor]|uniref:Bifunctional isochorismate lyase/aryl carrier protein n=1 Tax=Actinokineospora auranticolor TaxID=155976 RepID=A0A2S6GCY3_9PSEU|nr:isochorismatase family protein [Actinokineospora auranticolor]PPK62591.1 bifunctional isochorismate lyase/aryl carrier protein [Actinokineospora auranticolor]
MGLPTIAPYPMPAESELPKNRVEWVPDPDRAVLLVHDMQNHFLRAFDTTASPVVDLVLNIAALREVCRMLGVPVVFSAQPGGQRPDERGLQLDMWGNGIGQDPADAEIVAGLAPGGSDILMTKWRYNAFHRTELADVMAEHRRDQLIVTGIYAHIGCLMTTADAFMRDVQAFLVADAVADFSAEDHAMALRYAATRCGTTVTTTRLIEQLTGGRK